MQTSSLRLPKFIVWCNLALLCPEILLFWSRDMSQKTGQHLPEKCDKLDTNGFGENWLGDPKNTIKYGVPVSV
jgi:hypothetical protein